MKSRLDVYLFDDLVGRLNLGSDGMMAFQYDAAWLENDSVKPISHSLPLREQAYPYRECRGFFAGLLPEGDQRAAIAANLGFSRQNDFAFLEAIGGECAGAVTIIPEGLMPPDNQVDYKKLSDSKIAEIIQSLPRQPLMAGEEGVRLSLAGAQGKLAIHVQGQVISIPLYSSPSTHILKPENKRFEGLVENEVFCMRLAKTLGLKVAEAEVFNANGTKSVLVKRYDRYLNGEQVKRLHQEDFCQALGIASEKKYQSEGGPSLKDVFELIRESSSIPVVDIQSMLDVVIFNYIIGNHDAHGKNFSLLYKDDTLELAPFYDLVSTRVYPELSDRMAMKIGKEADSDKITRGHFTRTAEEVGLSKSMVEDRVKTFVEKTKKVIELIKPQYEIEKKILSLVSKNCSRLEL